MKYIILLLLLNVGCASTKQVANNAAEQNENGWFKTYMDDVEFYEFINEKGESFRFTHEDMIKINSNLKDHEKFWDNHVLKVILLKDNQ